MKGYHFTVNVSAFVFNFAKQFFINFNNLLKTIKLLNKMSPLLPLRDPLEDYKIKRYYNCVLAQTISSSGQFLFAGNRSGDIFVQR